MRYSERFTAAVHESAHAITQMALGWPFRSIELYDEGENAGIIFRGRIADPSATRRCLLTMAISCLASIQGERLLRPHLSRPTLIASRCGPDWIQAEELCRDLGLDIRKILRVASKMVKGWQVAIFKVAQELNVKGKLSYDEVALLCPEVAEAGQDFLALSEQQAA